MDVCNFRLGRAVVIASMVALTACTSTGEGDAETQSFNQSTTEVPGASLGSAFADPTKRYLSQRDVKPLHTVGAIDDATFALAERLRELAPVETVLSLRKLVSAETKPAVARLTSSEKALLPKLWSAFELVAVEEAVAIPSLRERMTFIDTAHAALDANASSPIATLPANLRLVAERIELVDDVDGDPDSIALADVWSVVASPAGFTSAEIAQLGRISDALADRQGPAVGRRVIEVPAPGPHDRAVTTIGPVELRLRERIRFVETRTSAIVDKHTASGPETISFEPLALADGFVLGKPADAQVVVTPFGSEVSSSFVFGGDTAVSFSEYSNSTLTAFRPILVEVYTNGTRTASKLLSLSSVSKKDMALNPWPGTELLVGGVALARVLESSVVIKENVLGPRTTSRLRTAWTYELDATRPTSQDPSTRRELDDAQVRSLESPPVRLALGDYEIPVEGFGSVRLHVFKNNLLEVTHAGSTSTMDLETKDGHVLYDKHGGPSPFIHLDPTTSELRVRAYDASFSTPWTSTVVDGRYRR